MEGKGGREAAIEGRAPTTLVSGGQTGGQADEGRRDWAATLLAGSAAPPIRTRHCRAKIDGAADPATSSVSAPVIVMLSLPPRHHA